MEAIVVVLVVLAVVVVCWRWTPTSQTGTRSTAELRPRVPSETIACNGVLPSAAGLIGCRLAADEKARMAAELMRGARFLGHISREAAQSIVDGEVRALPDGQEITAESYEAARCVFPGCSKRGVHGLVDGRIANVENFSKSLMFQSREGRTFFVSATCADKYVDDVAEACLVNYADYEAMFRRRINKKRMAHTV